MPQRPLSGPRVLLASLGLLGLSLAGIAGILGLATPPPASERPVAELVSGPVAPQAARTEGRERRDSHAAAATWTLLAATIALIVALRWRRLGAGPQLRSGAERDGRRRSRAPPELAPS